MSRLAHVAGHLLGLHIAGGAALLLIGATAVSHLRGCVAGLIAQRSRCMRIVSRDLGVVRPSWGRAVRAGLDDQRTTVSAASVRLGISRQYLERLLSGEAETIPIAHLISISDLAGVDPQEHTTAKDPWQNPS